MTWFVQELRKKNWKVMEALNAAESRIKVSANVKSSPVKFDVSFIYHYLFAFKEIFFNTASLSITNIGVSFVIQGGS